MARKLIEGFESGAVPFYNIGGSTITVNTTPDMGGGGARILAVTGYNGWRAFESVDSKSAYYVAFRVQQGSGNMRRCFAFLNGSTVLGCLDFDTQSSPRRFRFRIGDMSTEIGTSTTVPSLATTYLIEMYYLPHLTNGTITIKINGVQEINVTGVQTAAATSNIDGFYLGGGDNGAAYFDNIIFDDANWIGDTRIQGIVPTGAGNSTNWTPSTGSNYACVDEIPPSATDYISVNSNDVIDTYTMADLTGSIAAIKCVAVKMQALKTGLPTPQNIAGVVRTGGSDYSGSDQALTTDSKILTSMFEINPNTSSAWTESEVNGMEAGVKSRA